MNRMLRRGRALLVTLFCILSFLPSLPFAQELLNTMILTGALSSSSDGKVVPTTGDVVLAINANTGVTEGTGTADASGYGIILSDKPSSLNGVQLLLRLKHGGVTFKLLTTGGSDAIVAFNGSFLPVRVTMNLLASSTVVAGSGGGNTGGGSTGGNTGGSTGGTTGGTTPPPALKGDINGDGVVDEKDVQLLKQAISGRIPVDATKMDINGDGVVNTRDLIDLIRSMNAQAIKSREDQARSQSPVNMKGPASALPPR